eukprot:Awhi_evm1s9703
MMGVDAVCHEGKMFNLSTGYSAETSGGLLMCISQADADAFCKDIYAREGWKAFVIGKHVPITL